MKNKLLLKETNLPLTLNLFKDKTIKTELKKEVGTNLTKTLYLNTTWVEKKKYKLTEINNYEIVVDYHIGSSDRSSISFPFPPTKKHNLNEVLFFFNNYQLT